MLASPTTPSKRISTPAGQRLSAIMEDGNTNVPATASTSAPPPSRLTNMPLSRRLHLGAPPDEDEEKKPPSYASGDDGAYPSAMNPRKGFVPDRWEAEMKKRGGWKKVLLFVLIAVAIIIALGVGLGVGLGKHNNSSGDGSGSTASGGSAVPATTEIATLASPTPGPSSSNDASFPVGAYTFTTYLNTVSTDCVSNPDTWVCWPGSAYSPSDPTASQATFNWIISRAGSGGNSFVISNGDNLFQSIQLQNIPLTLENAGASDERYTFSSTQTKATSPSASLTNDNIRSSCFFNQTTISGSLYTSVQNNLQRRLLSNPRVRRQTSYTSWPGSVTVQQTSPGGTNVPNCYRVVNGNISGDEITGSGLEPQSSQSQCSCIYSSKAGQ